MLYIAQTYLTVFLFKGETNLYQKCFYQRHSLQRILSIESKKKCFASPCIAYTKTGNLKHTSNVSY